MSQQSALPRHHSPGAKHKVPDELARELIGVCLRALASFGVSPGRRALTALRGFPEHAPYARRMLEDADKLSMIHTRWQRQTGYFDQDAHPKVIPVSGPAPSFDALCDECGVHRERKRLLNLACALHMCARVGRGKVAQLSEIILFTGVPSLILAHDIVMVDRLLKTGAFNAKRGRKVSESLADRTTCVNLSSVEFRHFADPMRRLVHNFIESTDRRLLSSLAHDTRGSRPARGGRASGVTAFVFRDS